MDSQQALACAQRYFDAWNRRDAAAVLATFTADGTYSDPSTGGPIRGEALAGYMNGLWSAFPDLSFETASAAATGPATVAAQWVMHGTNHGSMMGLPPTGKAVTLQGADFIKVRDGAIQSVEGYFDSRAVPEQLGLQVIVQPRSVGPFTFGDAVRASAGSQAKPGAFSITALTARSEKDVLDVREQGRRITAEMLGMRGFISTVLTVVGDRMLTITAWENPEDSRQLLKGGAHADAMKLFYGPELGGGGVTAVCTPARYGPRWVRCGGCSKMVVHERSNGLCACGATLPAPAAYW